MACGVLLGLLGSSSCGDDGGEDKLSGEGESCERTADCEGDLRCVELECVHQGIAPDAGAGAGGDSPGALIDNGDGTATDPSSGLTWQVTPSGITMSHYDAMAFCTDLSANGQEDWRPPTVSELRSLIRGCEDTMTGGACGVTDDCVVGSCWTEPCAGLGLLAGPGDGGAYWPDGLNGAPYAYWSASLGGTSSQVSAWRVNFSLGMVDSSLQADSFNTGVRCVR